MLNTLADNTVQELTESIQKAHLDSNAVTTSNSENTNGDPVFTPFESIASAMVDIITDIRQIHDSVTPRLEDQEKRSTSLSDRFWPFKRTSSAKAIQVPVDGSVDLTLPIYHDMWESLLDSAASATNRLLLAHVASEAEEPIKRKNAPLFWLLYHGHG